MADGKKDVVWAFATDADKVVNVANLMRKHLNECDYDDVCATAHCGRVTAAGRKIVECARQGGFMHAFRVPLEELGLAEALERLPVMSEERVESGRGEPRSVYAAFVRKRVSSFKFLRQDSQLERT